MIVQPMIQGQVASQLTGQLPADLYYYIILSSLPVSGEIRK
jgi:hypothetical protein